MSSIPNSAAGYRPHTPEPEPASAAGFGATHQLIFLLAVLGLGAALFTTGTPMSAVFHLLGGCGAIGAGTVAAAGGCRRLVRVLVEAAVRTAAAK